MIPKGIVVMMMLWCPGLGWAEGSPVEGSRRCCTCTRSQHRRGWSSPRAGQVRYILTPDITINLISHRILLHQKSDGDQLYVPQNGFDSTARLQLSSGESLVLVLTLSPLMWPLWAGPPWTPSGRWWTRPRTPGWERSGPWSWQQRRTCTAWRWTWTRPWIRSLPF